jgi:hypothetical protein
VRAAKAPITPWPPADCAPPCTLRRKEGDVAGVCEPGFVREEGAVVRFERTGFPRLDETSRDRVVAYFPAPVNRNCHGYQARIGDNTGLTSNPL